VNLSGWQAIAGLGIAAMLALGGALIAALAPNGPAAAAAITGLFQLAAGIIAGTFAILQRNRDPASRTRTSDRRDTAAGGVPLERTPAPIDPRRP
jgi:hypothetical protein